VNEPYVGTEAEAGQRGRGCGMALAELATRIVSFLTTIPDSRVCEGCVADRLSIDRRDVLDALLGTRRSIPAFGTSSCRRLVHQGLLGHVLRKRFRQGSMSADANHLRNSASTFSNFEPCRRTLRMRSVTAEAQRGTSGIT
jgi:hypothetical protein